MVLAEITPEQTARACESATAETAGIVCRNVYSWTENDTMARAAEWLAERPLRIVLIVAVAFFLNRVGRGLVRRFVSGMRAQTVRKNDPSKAPSKKRIPTPSMLQVTRSLDPLRAAARAETIGTVLKSIVTMVVFTIAFMLVLGELGINLAPLIAGAGIAGIALGFGAQALVKDFLSGIFILVEDQYGVGDIIDLGEAVGEVEVVNLRTTEVRDVSGTLWHVPNGEIRRVGNMSQNWGQAVVEVAVAHDTALDRAMAVMQEEGDAMWHEDVWKTSMMGQPEMQGVQRIGIDGVTIRLLAKTQPGQQWAVTRELNRRIKDRFDAEGIEMPSLPRGSGWYSSPDAGVT